MLDRMTSAHFRPLLGRTCKAVTSAGEVLDLCVDAVKEHPRARPPEVVGEGRVPFSVSLTALAPTGFIGGSCSVELETVGSLASVQLVRVAPLGRNNARSYFQIVFN